MLLPRCLREWITSTGGGVGSPREEIRKGRAVARSWARWGERVLCDPMGRKNPE